MKASGLKSPPNQTVLDLRAKAPELATDLEMPSNCLIRKQKSWIHWMTVVSGGILYRIQD
jgi:hypothetical protein